MTTFENTRKALVEFDAGASDRNMTCLKVQTNADVEAADKADKDALAKVQEAFWEDTKEFNSRDIIGNPNVHIEWMRQVAKEN